MKTENFNERKTKYRSTEKQKGQSVVEFLVSASIILVPLMFLVTYLGKVGDIQHRAYESARYAAWESARTNKEATSILHEIDNRIIRKPYIPIDSVMDSKRAQQENPSVDPIYYHTGNDGEYKTLLEYSRGGISQGEIIHESPESTSYKFVVKLLTAGVTKFNVNEAGLMTATVEIPLHETRWLEDMKAHPRAWNTMLTDSWQAVTRNKVEETISPAILAKHQFIEEGILQGASDLASLIGLEEWAALEPGHIEHDVVPCSRVIGGGGDEDACR